MKEKYEDLKMEVVAFEDDIWTQSAVRLPDTVAGSPTTLMPVG